MYASVDAYFGGDGIRDGEVLLRYTSRILVLILVLDFIELLVFY
jgi:hypothetical protein